jgi:hypothetical protein
MAFEKKAKVATQDSRPQQHSLALREAKVRHLKELNSVEARATLKKMNDKVYRGSRSNLKDWYAPNGVATSATGKQTMRK